MIIDGHSKWPEVSVIQKLCEVFSGLDSLNSWFAIMGPNLCLKTLRDSCKQMGFNKFAQHLITPLHTDLQRDLSRA